MSGTSCAFGSQVRVQHSTERGVSCLVHPGSRAQHDFIQSTELDNGKTVEIHLLIFFVVHCISVANKLQNDV